MTAPNNKTGQRTRLRELEQRVEELEADRDSLRRTMRQVRHGLDATACQTEETATREDMTLAIKLIDDALDRGEAQE